MLHPQWKNGEVWRDSMNLIQTNTASVFPCAFILSAIGSPFIVWLMGTILAVQSESSEMCQHVTGSGRCPANPSWHKLLPVFAFTPSPPPTPSYVFPSTLPFFVLLLFFFLSHPLSRRPGSHAPSCGLVWPFLPPLTHTFAHLSISYRAHWLDIAHIHAWYEDKLLASLR